MPTKKTVVELIRLKSAETGALSHLNFQNILIYVIKLLVIAKNNHYNLFVCAHRTIYYMNMAQNHINNIVILDIMKRFFKKLLKAYFDGVNEMYGPVIRAGINPFT